MEKFMKNEILQPVIETLQYKVNSTLGEFAKAFIERSDYETLGSIAKIGIDVNSFLDGLFLSFSSTEQLPLIEAELIIENDDEPEAVTLERDKLPREVYSQMKTFIFNYIGKRGGKASVYDLSCVFHEEFKSNFTEYHYTLVNGTTPKWQHKMYDQVKTLRTKGIIAPKASGQDYDYYSLTPRALKSYSRAALKIEKQLSLPDLEMTG
jgi:hypothetical protein